jgi:hypothetical protein
MKMRYIASAVGFSFCVFGGIYSTVHSTLATTYYPENPNYISSSRIPAAIRRDLDFSELRGADLVSASQKRLLTAARVILQGDQMGIELGHFVLRDEAGRSQLACDYYDGVKMTFEAEGIADSGEKPVMEIEGPCRSGTDMTRIEAIWVPVARILDERPADMDLAYDNENVHFHFKNMGTEWPTRWALQAVHLYNSQEPGREVNVEHADLHEIMAHPLVLNWQSQLTR